MLARDDKSLIGGGPATPTLSSRPSEARAGIHNRRTFL
jgi:hypothetical protein